MRACLKYSQLVSILLVVTSLQLVKEIYMKIYQIYQIIPVHCSHYISFETQVLSLGLNCHCLPYYGFGLQSLQSTKKDQVHHH